MPDTPGPTNGQVYLLTVGFVLVIAYSIWVLVTGDATPWN